MTSFSAKKSVTLKSVYEKKKTQFLSRVCSWSGKMYISFLASPLMKYAFLTSLDEINGIFIPKIEYPLYIRWFVLCLIIWIASRGDSNGYSQKTYILSETKLYSKTCVKWPLSKRPKIGFQGQLPLYAGQRHWRMLQWEHSAMLLTFTKLYFVIKIFVLSNFEWPFNTGLLYPHYTS